VVASYNIHGCVGTDRRHDTNRIAEVIRELDAEVLGLQELHAPGVDAASSDDPVSSGRIGFEVSGTTLVGPRGDYGIALFSRYPIRAVRRIDLSVPPREPRCASTSMSLSTTARSVLTTHSTALGEAAPGTTPHRGYCPGPA
jgi:endonuclease/exonuclease/phosphatase family metal-dependent hydrolase